MRVSAVIVAYFPGVDVLDELAGALVADGCHVVIVDNTPESAGAWRGAQQRCISYLPLGGNLGIAKAQNVGIEQALAMGAEAIILFDQDSRYSPGIVPEMVGVLDAGQCGVVAPVCIDDRSGRELSAHRLVRRRFGWVSVEKVRAMGSQQPLDVDLVMASGTLATAETYRSVGCLDESLFIDFVDFEWCLRCRARGVRVHIVPSATMRHNLGMRTVNLWVMGGILHGAERTYYKVRNPILLLRKKHVPWAFALRETLIAVAQGILVAPKSSAPLRHMRSVTRGLWDGVRGVGGPRIS